MSTKTDTFAWRTYWVLWRNAVLGSAAFQRWACSTPGMRAIGRRKAAAQFDLVAGFVYSQILFACVETGLVEWLRGGPRTDGEVATFLSLGDAATARLLHAAAALKIVESPEASVWTLGEAGAALSANVGAMAMIRHHALLYRDLADPVELLARDRRSDTELSSFWSYAAKDGDGGTDTATTRPYSALMAATQPMIAEQAIAAYPFRRHRRILDIGGGSGGFAMAVADAAPQTAIGIFDLPGVIGQAGERIAERSDAGRFTLFPGSFRDDPLPPDHDLVTLVRILHDHDDDVVTALLAAIHRALPSGGKVLIIEPMARVGGAERMGDAYFGLYLWAMGQGRPRSAAMLRTMLNQAGFSRCGVVRTHLPLITSALVATR